MAGTTAARLVAIAALQQHVANKMAAEKKVVEARAHVRAITLLLEEEQASATALEAEAAVAAL
jgi:hypothetical protein